MNYKNNNEDYKPPTRDTKQKFIKQMKYIVFCKKCGKEIRFYDGWNWRINVGLCYGCRQGWFKERYHQFRTSPHYKAQNYQSWKRWTVANIVKRRRQALESYHRNKAKHKQRRHRATKKPT